MFLFNIKCVLISVTMSCFRFMWYISCQCSIWFEMILVCIILNYCWQVLKRREFVFRLNLPWEYPFVFFIFALKGYEPELSDNIRINGKRVKAVFTYFCSPLNETCLSELERKIWVYSEKNYTLTALLL